MLARQAGGSRRSLLTDTSAASFRVRIISSKRAKVNTVTARGRIQSNYRWAGGAEGPRPRPPLQAWGSRSRQQGPPLRGAPRGFLLPGGTLTPSGPLSSASTAPTSPRWPGPTGPWSSSAQALAKAGPGLLCLSKAARRSAGRLSSSAGGSAAVSLPTGQGPPSLYLSTIGPLPPRRLLSGGPSFWAPGTAVKAGEP